MSKRNETVATAKFDSQLNEFAVALEETLATITKMAQTISSELAKGNIKLALANATPYLDMFGHMIIGWK